MNLDRLLQLATCAVVVPWALMIVAPRWRGTRALLHSDAVPIGLGIVYVGLLFPILPRLIGQIDTLEHLGAAFADRKVLLAAWLHYLAFDLVVGRVILADAQRRGVPHALVAPCLVLTFAFGPLGYLAYAAVRLARRDRGPVVPVSE